MANTYILISSSTVGSGGAASIDFNSIPQTYTDLKIVFSLRTTDSGAVFARITFNGAGGTAYQYRNLYAFSNVAYSNADNSGIAHIESAYQNNSSLTANTFSNGEIYVPNYTLSNVKCISNDGVQESNSSTGVAIGLVAGVSTNTAAITRITLTPQAGNFVQYSTAYLYGISNA
jgi:hypothetical protein